MEELWVYVKDIIKPLDVLSIVITYFITQRVKVSVSERLRPVIAIAVGMAVSLAWAVTNGGYREVLAYGFMYGAGAIALYMLRFDDLVSKLFGREKGNGD